MSGDDNGPRDPFGRSERTIIRPRPAGRGPAAPPPSATPPPATPPPPAASPPPGQNAGDEWVAAVPPPQAAGGERQEGRARALVLRREELLTPNDNPLMRAAGPLLLLLGELRVGTLRAPFAQLMEQVADSIEEFERDVRAAGLPADETRVAKYVLAATADDIVQNIPGEDRHVWTQYSMLSRFFGERVGGVRFFDELERARADPSVNYALLELMHACLALGFQGVHRTSAGGAAALQQIERGLYETLRRVKRANEELSPRWQGQAVPVEAARLRVPVWAVASLAGVILLGLFLLLRSLLGNDSEAVAASLIAVHPTSEIGIQRRVFSAPPPPPPSAQASRLQQDLKGEKILVQESGNKVLIRISDLPLFAPGQAVVRNEFKPLLARIAAAVEKEPGTVKIVGHTDSVPIRTVRFPSNFVLSQERAKAVADLIKAQLTNPGRVATEGKGADQPIASNATADGRAKNRRVEILIERSS